MKKNKFLLKLFVVCGLLILTLTAEEMNTLFGSEDSQSNETILYSGFGAVFVKATTINSDWGVEIGGRGGVLIDQVFSFGGVGKGFVGDFDFTGSDKGNPASNTIISTTMGAGGVYFEYIWKLENLIHFSIPLNVMAGGIKLSKESNNEEIEKSGFFLLEPGVNLELNVHKYFILALNVGYRFAMGSSLSNLSDNDLSGPFVGLEFKFGLFDEDEIKKMNDKLNIKKY